MAQLDRVTITVELTLEAVALHGDYLERILKQLDYGYINLALVNSRECALSTVRTVSHTVTRTVIDHCDACTAKHRTELERKLEYVLSPITYEELMQAQASTD